MRRTEHARTRLQVGDDARERPRQVGERIPATGVGLAVGEQPVEGAVRVDAHVRRQAHGNRGEPVEHGGPDPIGMAPHVDETGTGAVRAAQQVDRLVAERGAHLVEVVHRDRRRVVPRVGVGPDLVQALAQALQRQGVDPERLVRPVAVGGALEEGADHLVRAAGAPLIDEDEVARPADPGQQPRHRPRQPGGSLARTARQEEERVGLGAVGDGRNDDDLQLDGPAGARGAILEDGKGSAPCGDGHPVQTAILQLEQRLRARGARHEQTAQCDCQEKRSPQTVPMLPNRHVIQV